MDQSRYSQDVQALLGTMILGYQAEAEDPDFPYKMPPHEELEWLASWVISEGWEPPERLANWKSSGE